MLKDEATVKLLTDLNLDLYDKTPNSSLQVVFCNAAALQLNHRFPPFLLIVLHYMPKRNTDDYKAYKMKITT